MPTPLLTAIAEVCRLLNVQAYWVGGTVRDQLLGRESHDWDLVCRHAYTVSKRLATRLRAKLITLDEHHRIYRIIPQEGITVDFAELEGKTIEQDLARRDFTMNAMAIPVGGFEADKGDFSRMIDPFKGQRDLKHKVLRALSRKAFVEDPLRLLRAYRLAAQFELTLEPRTLGWIAAEHERLEAGAVARERVREEFLKLLSQPASAGTVAAMDRSGLLTAIFPELEAGRRVGRAYYGKGGVLKHHLQSLANVEWIIERLETADAGQGWGFAKDPAILTKTQAYVRRTAGGFERATFLKLGALLHDIGKPATAEVIRGRLRFFGHEDVGAGLARKLLDKLRFSRQETFLLSQWVRNHMRPGSLASAPRLTDKAMARFFRDLDEEGIGMLIISLADHYTYLPRAQWGKGKDAVEQTARKLLEAYFLKRDTVLPPRVVDGHQLMKRLRLKPGPVIGKLLEAVRDAQTEGRVQTLEEAVAFARKVLKAEFS